MLYVVSQNSCYYLIIPVETNMVEMIKLNFSLSAVSYLARVDFSSPPELEFRPPPEQRLAVVATAYLQRGLYLGCKGSTLSDTLFEALPDPHCNCTQKCYSEHVTEDLLLC